MATSQADRNLVFAALALQTGFLSRDQLKEGFNRWALDKSRALDQVLVEQGVLAESRRDVLQELVEEHLAAHCNDVEKCLTTLGYSTFPLEPLGEAIVADILISRTMLETPSPEGDNGVPPSNPAPGNGLRFRVVRSLARGGLGEVFVAEDSELHREVALKTLQARFADDPESRARFLLEAEITGRLEHPGIVPVYGLTVGADGRPFYAMRLIKGETLLEAIRRFHQGEETGSPPGERTLALRDLLTRFIATCYALAYAHSRGVLHRDLKPANILLGPYGETLVVDWGLAKTLGQREASSSETTLHPVALGDSGGTEAGQVMGTPAYVSPEQAAGLHERLGPPSDVYSLGATLYHLLTGQAPFSGGTSQDVLDRVKAGQFLPPRQVNRTVPRPLEAICLKAMALRPEDRYGSARSLAADLEHWLADEPVTALRDGPVARGKRWIRHHTTLATTFAALVLLVGITLVFGLALVNKELRGEQQAQREKARERVDSLCTLNAKDVPRALELLDLDRPEVLERLHELWDASEDPIPPLKRMRAGLALLSREPDRVLPDLVTWMLEADNPDELVPLLKTYPDKPEWLLRMGSVLSQALTRRANSKEPSVPNRRQGIERPLYLAAALLHLGQTEAVWQLFRHGPNPELRSYLIHRLPAFQVDPQTLLVRLDQERNDEIRRALILSLGQFGPKQLPADLKKQWGPRLLEWYRNDPDPGIHGAIDWLLRYDVEGRQPRPGAWQLGEELARIDRTLAGKPSAERRWQVDRFGHTLVLFRGPVEVTMGSPPTEPGRSGNEWLRRRIIPRSFAVATKLVTNRQFQAFLNANPTLVLARPGDPRRPLKETEAETPALGLTWYEAAQYCRWLSEQEKLPESEMCFPSIAEIEKHKKDRTEVPLPRDYLSRKGYRLPTDAEFEYVCRAGATTSRFYGSGDDLLTYYAWYRDNSANQPWPVGQKKPNDFGFFDVLGNAAQWALERERNNQADAQELATEDREYFGENFHSDPKKKPMHILSSGSFSRKPEQIRCALRNYFFGYFCNPEVGFRVARTIR
jgi:serine/threonine protein kinase/formylglycine-generating enzyme required for sulfatase activity